MTQLQPHVSASPSELILHNDCGHAHFRRYIQRLRLRTPPKPGVRASGLAVHYAIEHFCLNYGGTIPTNGDLEALACEYLAEEFTRDEDGGARNLKKFLPGVIRALHRVPEWVWQAQWVTEADISATWERSCPACAIAASQGHACQVCDDTGVFRVEVHGRPDLYRVADASSEAPYLQILDVKTTDVDPLQFMLWTPQIRMYAAILSQVYAYPIEYSYLCVPTAVKWSMAPFSPSFLFTPKSHAQTLDDIFRLALDLRIGNTTPREARRCQWCDYAPICIARITGADPEGIASELFTTPAEREREQPAPLQRELGDLIFEDFA